MLRSERETPPPTTDKDNVGGFISDCNILARDSMGFVHALLLVNITFVPYRPDIDTVQTGKSTYTWLAIIIIFLPLVNGWIVDNDEEGLFLVSNSSSPSTSLGRLPVDDDAPAVTHDIDQCPCHGGFCCYCCGCSAEQWMNE